MSEYIFKTEPRKHQLESFLGSRDKKAWSLWWRMGLGKSKATVDNFCYLYEQKKINAVVVIAPPGVESNWPTREMTKHCPDRIQWSYLVWEAKRAKQKGVQKQQVQFMEGSQGLKVLCVSYASILTPLCFEYVKKFMTKHVCFTVLDESQKIKTPGNKTTVRVTSLSPRSAYKRALSGSPITKWPLDVFSQVRFTDPNFWVQNRLHPYVVFKAAFCDFMDERTAIEALGYVPNYPVLLGYKNQDMLKELLRQVGHRLTLESAGVELPPIVFKQTVFRMTKKVRAVYDSLKKDHMVALPESGSVLDVEHQIAVQSKLHQVVCGYVCVEAGEPWELIDSSSNPRLDALVENLNNLEGKTIIWSKFNMDIDLIMETLKKMGRNPVRYDGSVSTEQRARNIDAFQDGDATDFVAKPRSGATGLTLTAAESIHHFTCSYDYDERVQADARAHRMGLDHSLLCFDYIADGTVDQKIIPNLRAKDIISRQLLGDKMEIWI